MQPCQRLPLGEEDEDLASRISAAEVAPSLVAFEKRDRQGHMTGGGREGVTKKEPGSSLLSIPCCLASRRIGKNLGDLYGNFVALRSVRSCPPASRDRPLDDIPSESPDKT